MQKHFHNTNGTTGQDLIQRVQRAKSQDEAVLLVFKEKRGQKYSASQMHQAFLKAGKTWPVTSVRRALTNLMNEGHLVKLDEKRMGPHGEPEHYYTLNLRKHPTDTGAKQQPLF